MSSRVSSATAASTAAINSGSGGSGMYSFAPAWMAATAALASVAVPAPPSPAVGSARPAALPLQILHDRRRVLVGQVGEQHRDLVDLLFGARLIDDVALVVLAVDAVHQHRHRDAIDAAALDHFGLSRFRYLVIDDFFGFSVLIAGLPIGFGSRA